jgi:hypothetical protein
MRPSIFIWSLLSLAGRSYASSDCGAISNNITWRLESMEYDPGLSVGTDDVVHIVMQLWMDDENLDGEDCDYFGAVKDSWYRCRNSKTPSGGPDDDISDWHVKINPTTWEVIIKHDWTCTSDDQTRYVLTLSSYLLISLILKPYTSRDCQSTDCVLESMSPE